MTRPSRNVDELLLQAGRELLPETGCRGLSIRQVAERAGVNLGMFHYHFKTRENFVRTLLQQLYEDMFSRLSPGPSAETPPLEALRAAIRVVGRFARDNRRVLLRIVADAFGGDALAMEFLRTNLPRHLSVVMSLIGACQSAGALRPMPLPQAMGFLAGSVGSPILIGTAIAESGFAPPQMVAGFEAAVLSDEAIDERIDMALRGLCTDPLLAGTGALT
jgi:AcrR family transcriptional regulator